MLNTKQELYERVYASIGGDDITEEYQMLLDMLLSFPEEEKQELDFDKIKHDFLWHVSMNELELPFSYKFSRQLSLDLNSEINDIVKRNGNTKTLASFIGLHDLDDDEIVTLTIKAIKKTMPESTEDLEIIQSLKQYLEEKSLYPETIRAIKSSGDPETLVCSALFFEPRLIDEVFGGKKNMYFYLTANTFTDEEDIEYFKERLLSMDNDSLKNKINKSAQKIDTKIKQKRFNQDI